MNGWGRAAAVLLLIALIYGIYKWTDWFGGGGNRRNDDPGGWS